ncbi:MAG: AraC family transcriptional regulator [Lachnospiraceae bacterium]
MEEYKSFNQYYIPSKFALDNLIVSDNMGCVASNDFQIERNSFDDALVLFVIEGVFHIEQYGMQYKLTPMNGVFMKLSDAHKYYSDKVEGATFLWMHVRGSAIDCVINTISNYNSFPILFQEIGFDDKMQACFEIAKNKESGYEFVLSCKLYELVLGITRPCLENIAHSIVKKQSWFVERVGRYVENHICEKITLEMMSDELNMSVFTFSKMFVKFFSLSPIQYVLFQKVTYSLQLLKEDYSIQEIAYVLSFSDQSHYTKTFKKQMGVSPLKYKSLNLH